MANKKPKGRMANTRYLFRGEKLTVETLLNRYEVGSKVVIKPNGKYEYGLPFRRFAGHIGEIIAKEGRNTYVIYVSDMHKTVKTTNPHIRALN
jgi:ribosomal protein L21E